MRHIYRLKYPNYVIDKNKIEITNLHVFLGLHGLADSRRVNSPRCLVLCFFQVLSILLDVNYKIFFFLCVCN